jgi:hypothetical protein
MVIETVEHKLRQISECYSVEIDKDVICSCNQHQEKEEKNQEDYFCIKTINLGSGCLLIWVMHPGYKKSPVKKGELIKRG